MTYDAAPDPSARQGRKTVNESQDTPLSEGSWQPFLTVNACGRDWTLERAADMEALWESMTEFTEDERLPYWTELWPSSLVLADWLYQRRESLRGQPCLDLGCGIGLTALVAQWLGANVIGMDYEPEALRFARRNAEHNAVPQPLWTVMDWRKPAVKRRSLRFIWGGDIMYEQRFAAPVLDFLEYALAEGGVGRQTQPGRLRFLPFHARQPPLGGALRLGKEHRGPVSAGAARSCADLGNSPIEGATMGETVRFGVSLDSDLLEKFDALCERQGCPSRSEALRDIIRDALVQDSLHSETADAAGVLSLIYDHHVRDLSRKLTERQHDAHGLIVTTLHVHLDHHNCLEILVLKGKAGELRELADQLRSIRGVTHGTFSITTIGADLP